MEIFNQDFLRIAAIADNLKFRGYLVDKFNFSSYPAIIASVGFDGSVLLNVSVADDIEIVAPGSIASLFNVVVRDREFDWAMDTVLDYLTMRKGQVMGLNSQ
jgi:hypothetical protein